MASKTPKLVVALDIGTTYSGYAWQYRGDFESNPSKVGLNDWRQGLKKTSTAILFSNFKAGIVDSIGFIAQERHAEHGANPKYKNWRLFQNFKLLLYGETFRNDQIVEAVGHGDYTSLQFVMTSFIRELKEQFIKDSRKRGHQLVPDSIRWVITVPAIWNDAAKFFMKKCSETAITENKQIKSQTPDVLIALEPEAAAIYCLYLSKEERQAMGGLGEIGDSFLLADLGGGTADVSVQKVVSKDKFEQLCAPCGEPTGGEDINNTFFMSIADEFENNSWREAWQCLSAKQVLKAEWKLREEFEMRKVKITRDATSMDEWIRVEIPRPLIKQLHDGKGSGCLRQKKGCDLLQIEDEEFYIKGELLREKLFKTTASAMFHILKKALNDSVPTVRKVVLVGGVSESGIITDYIREFLKKEFPERNIKVYVPQLPMQAVLTGAVLFGHEPGIFETRVSRYTYGIRKNGLYDRTRHEEYKRYEDKGIVYCKDYFDIHIRKNQKVKLNDRMPALSYSALRQKTKTVKLQIYVSSENDPKYTDEATCKHLADIWVDLPDKSTKEVNVSMVYGETVISVEAVEKSTGKPFNFNIEYKKLEGFEDKSSLSSGCMII